MLRILRFLEFFYHLKFKTERNVSGIQVERLGRHVPSVNQQKELFSNAGQPL